MGKYIKWVLIIAGIVILYNLFIGTYNSLVSREAEVDAKWANVEAQYQRRTDLFKNLVSTVKGYADHEQKTLIETVEARANATSIKLSADDLTAENLKKFEAAQAQLSQGIGRLMAIGESYPDLKASQNFISLQDEIAGTENRVTKARTDFNQAVKEYNVYLKKFPRNLLSGIYGFEARDMFEAQEGTQNAPDIEF